MSAGYATFLGASIALVIIAAMILVMPWVFKFMDWYFPWVGAL